MKRWIPIGVVLVLVILAFGLCATAWNPGEFSGDWYCAETGELFRFQDGLENPRQLYLIHGTDGDRLCGSKDGSGETYFYRSQQAALAS